MTFLKKYILLFFLLLFLIANVIGQNLNKENLEVRFLNEQIEIDQKKSFFNILYIKNKTDKAISFNLQFNTPKGWNIIGDSYKKITLQAYAEASIPVRVILSKQVMGGVGYAIVAVISDNNGSIYNTVYTFVKIPIVSSVKIKTNTSFAYFNQKNLKSEFEISIENSGNIDELISIHFLPDGSLTTEKESDIIIIDNIDIKSGETKKILYNVKLSNEIDLEKYQIHKLKLNINLLDTILEKTIWFKYMDWQYNNIMPDMRNPINIELIAFNIFSNEPPRYIYSLYGNILLKNRKEFIYNFQKYNRIENANLYINSRIEMQFNTPKTSVFIGDYAGALEYSMYGRGISIEQKIGDNVKIQGIATKRLTTNTEKYGFSYIQKLKFSLLDIGAVYSQDPAPVNKFILGYAKINTSILKNNVSVLYGNSQSRYDINNLNNRYRGWGYKATFSRKIRNINLNISSVYGNPNYIGIYKGRSTTVGSADLKLNKRKQLYFNYFRQSYRPVILLNSALVSDRYRIYQKISTVLYHTTPNNIKFYISPIVEESSTNNFIYYTPDDVFGTRSMILEAGTRGYNKYTDNSFSFSIRYGFVSVYDYSTVLNGISYEERTGETLYNIAQIRAAYKNKNLGVHLMYYIGPYQISQQFSYFYTFSYSKSLTIVPFYQKDLFNKKIKIIFRGTYINNLTAGINRMNVNSEIDWFVGKSWVFKLYNTTSLQKTNSASRTSSYNSSYFQFSIAKSFNFQQPRLKYYNYNAVFYKDLNGNRIHDANEPGVSNVLAEINRAYPEQDLQDKNYNGEFLSNELFSNEQGEIEYNNIAEGEYTIKYTPQGIQTDNFESESNSKHFTSKKDTVMYIPFMERNKLFGKINLNRTKHSALGDIPINNIKVIVEGDSKSYSTVTDKDGYFEMYIPVSDYYKVKINNIFHEHFNLRQEYYIVKFNGYKKFELSFDFDEKERKIAFDESDFLITDDESADGDFSFDDIKVIKQTNIKGYIKDANSLIPLHSTVSIHNTATHQLISETASSKRTGVYFTSFFAERQYNITAVSKGYWIYKADLNINQITTFENITHDILLNKIFLDEEIKTENLKFKKESDELSPLALAELDNLLPTLFINPAIHIEISGHTDNIEALLLSPTELSKARASAVASYLVKHGLKESRIQIKALGNSSPISQDDSETGRARNRRVEIKVAAF